MMQRRHLILGAGLLLTIGLVVFGNQTPDTNGIELAARPASPARHAAASAGDVTPPARRRADDRPVADMLLALVPRKKLIGRRGDDALNALFDSRSFAPPPPVAAIPAEPVEPVAPPPEPVPYKYLGKQDNGHGWQAFLEKGDDILIAGVDQAVGHDDYRVKAIADNGITLEKISTHDIAILPIESQP